VVVAVTGNGQLGETTVPVVDSGLVEEGGLERRPLRIWAVQIDAGEVNLGKIESGSRYVGVYRLRLYKSTAHSTPSQTQARTGAMDIPRNYFSVPRKRWVFPRSI
jgi:hypothetical protein